MKKYCNYPSCSIILAHGRYCQLHQHAKPKRKAKIYSEPDEIRNTDQWRKARRTKLSLNPICEDPHGFHGKYTRTATEVHHIKRLATNQEQAYELDNLMSLCSRCHAVFNRRERGQETIADRALTITQNKTQ